MKMINNSDKKQQHKQQLTGRKDLVMVALPTNKNFKIPMNNAKLSTETEPEIIYFEA